MSDVQVKLDAAVAYLSKTTSSGSQFIATYGTDWTKWPVTSNWYQARKAIADARAEAGQTLTASFSAKEV